MRQKGRERGRNAWRDRGGQEAECEDKRAHLRPGAAFCQFPL
jgi:hypothetical protein